MGIRSVRCVERFINDLCPVRSKSWTGDQICPMCRTLYQGSIYAPKIQIMKRGADLPVCLTFYNIKDLSAPKYLDNEYLSAPKYLDTELGIWSVRCPERSRSWNEDMICPICSRLYQRTTCPERSRRWNHGWGSDLSTVCQLPLNGYTERSATQARGFIQGTAVFHLLQLFQRNSSGRSFSGFKVARFGGLLMPPVYQYP